MMAKTMKPRGSGQGFAHHGEILQGVFEDANAQLFRGLVTFPIRHLSSKAVFTPNSNGCVGVWPRSNEKARRAAALTLRRVGGAQRGGHVEISTDIPMGRGLGSSTADVLAAIHAVLDCFDAFWRPEQIMQVAVEAETACDSTLFSQNSVLFAQRDGIVLEAFDRPLPMIDVISVDCAPETTVSTLEFQPALYDDFEVEAFRPLRSLLKRAVRLGDAGLVGKVATASGLINQRFLPKPRLEELHDIARNSGAVGIQVAHSGTVVGLMFDHTSPHRQNAIERAMIALDRAAFSFQIFAA